MNWRWIAAFVTGVVMVMELTGCTKTKPVTLRWVALGDSLTVGYGAAPEQSYPSRIVVKSRVAHLPLDLVKNLANGGHTLAKLQLLQLLQVESYRPDIVTIWIGTNDAILSALTGKTSDFLTGETLPTPPEDFERRLDEVLAALHPAQLKHIFIGKLHDLSAIPAAADWNDGKKATVKKHVVAYNHIFEKAAQKYPNVTLVPLDQLSTLHNPKRYLSDGVHPRPLSYRQIAEAWWKVMANKLQETPALASSPTGS